MDRRPPQFANSSNFVEILRQLDPRRLQLGFFFGHLTGRQICHRHPAALLDVTQVTMNLLSISIYEQFTALDVGASSCWDARADDDHQGSDSASRRRVNGVQGAFIPRVPLPLVASGFATGGFQVRAVAAKSEMHGRKSAPTPESRGERGSRYGSSAPPPAARRPGSRWPAARRAKAQAPQRPPRWSRGRPPAMPWRTSHPQAEKILAERTWSEDGAAGWSCGYRRPAIRHDGAAVESREGDPSVDPGAMATAAATARFR